MDRVSLLPEPLKTNFKARGNDVELMSDSDQPPKCLPRNLSFRVRRCPMNWLRPAGRVRKLVVSADGVSLPNCVCDTIGEKCFAYTGVVDHLGTHVSGALFVLSEKSKT